MLQINQNMASDKEISIDELSTHNTEKDAWIAIDGIVYDISNFIPNHPGGAAILKGIGTDATELFHAVEAHIKVQIQEYLEKNIIGQLKQA